MMKLAIRTLLVLLPVVACATEWRCRNNDMEITCTSEKCLTSTSDGFTPMDVSFNDRGSMNICAYSGCWEGKGKVLKSENHIFLSGHKLSWSGTTHGSGDFMIALDKGNGIAVINGEGFAMPLICNSGSTAKRPNK